MGRCDVEVVKVGGSLIGRQDFVPALRTWLRGRVVSDPNCHLVLVVGGGPLVDALRVLDHARPLATADAHWRAVELMEVTGRVVAAWFSEFVVADTFADLTARCTRPGVTLWLPLDFLQNDEPTLGGTVLEMGWHVTSDSIAARMAICLAAPRLRLLKSRLAVGREARNWAVAAEGGLVDAFFRAWAHRSAR